MRFFGYSVIVKRLRCNWFRKTPVTHTCRAQAQALEGNERHIGVHDRTGRPLSDDAFFGEEAALAV